MQVELIIGLWLLAVVAGIIIQFCIIKYAVLSALREYKSNEKLTTIHLLGNEFNEAEKQAGHSNEDNSFANNYFNRAAKLHSKGMLDEAVEGYTKAIRHNPQHIEAYIERGRAFFQLNNYTSAINDYDKALSIEPNGVHAKKAALYREQAVAKLGQEQTNKLPSKTRDEMLIEKGYIPCPNCKILISPTSSFCAICNSDLPHDWSKPVNIKTKPSAEDWR